jgi:hypothetical protein
MGASFEGSDDDQTLDAKRGGELILASGEQTFFCDLL